MPWPSRTCTFGASSRAANYSLSACFLETFGQPCIACTHLYSGDEKQSILCNKAWRPATPTAVHIITTNPSSASFFGNILLNFNSWPTKCLIISLLEWFRSLMHSYITYFLSGFWRHYSWSWRTSGQVRLSVPYGNVCVCLSLHIHKVWKLLIIHLDMYLL